MSADDSMFSDGHEIVVPASRIKLVAVAFGSAGFVLLGAWMVTLAREEGALIATIGAASIVFFGLCGGYAVRRIARPEPAVVINGEGIVDNSSLLSVGLIRWDEIAELREYQFKRQTFLAVIPKDADRLLARQPAWKRSAIRANLAIGAAPVNIPQSVVPVRISELLHEIRRRFGGGRPDDRRVT